MALLRAAFALTGTWRARDGVHGTACAERDALDGVHGTGCAGRGAQDECVLGMSKSRENRGVFIEFVPVATVCRL